VICCGYKGYVIKEYFANYFLHMSDVTIDMTTNQMQVHHKKAEPWKITLVDTGNDSMTGGRIKRVQEYVKNEKSFFLTYGDGVSDVDITQLIHYHQQQGVSATLTAIQPAGRFGSLNTDEQGRILSFQEKPKGDGNWINGGFFVLEPQVFDLIEGDQTIWEQKPLQELARKQQLAAFHHQGFWQAMDTLRDKTQLENLWQSKQAPWKVW
jgi:glucose-1-phosphate cytidylyltransferase